MCPECSPLAVVLPFHILASGGFKVCLLVPSDFALSPFAHQEFVIARCNTLPRMNEIPLKPFDSVLLKGTIRLLFRLGNLSGNNHVFVTNTDLPNIESSKARTRATQKGIPSTYGTISSTSCSCAWRNIFSTVKWSNDLTSPLGLCISSTPFAGLFFSHDCFMPCENTVRKRLILELKLPLGSLPRENLIFPGVISVTLVSSPKVHVAFQPFDIV